MPAWSAIMKNWLATANFMYRQVLVKSLASSASLVVVRIVLLASTPNSLRRPFGGRVGVRADDLRQRVQLFERVALGDPLGAERDVDPAAAIGEVLGDVAGRARDRRCCAGPPARRRGGAARSGRRPSRRSSSMARGTRRPGCRSRRPGSRVRAIMSPFEPNARRPVGRTSRRSSSAPFSMNGISPAAIRSRVAWFVS